MTKFVINTIFRTKAEAEEVAAAIRLADDEWTYTVEGEGRAWVIVVADETGKRLGIL